MISVDKKKETNILIIDDDEIIANVLMEHFRYAGYENANFVITEKDFFGHIREYGYPDIFVTDFRIVGATDGNCLHMIDTCLGKVPLIVGVTSFFDDMEIRTMLFEAGACDVESKTNFAHAIRTIEYLIELEEQLDERKKDGGI